MQTAPDRLSEAPAAPPPGRGGRRARRWLLRLAVVTALAAAAEAAAYCAWWAIDGHRFSYAQVQHRRHQLLAEEAVPQPIFGPPPMADLHPYLGFVYNPDFRGAMLRGEDPASEWGFTDKANRSPVRKRGPGKVIVGILGASVASIFAAQGVDALERELRRSPRFADKEIEFVSLSVGSYKQPQQLMALTYALAMGAEFDVIVNLDGLNEVAWYLNDNGPNGISHLYPIGWHWFVSPARHLSGDGLSGKAAEVKSARRDWAAPFQHAPLRFSVAANLVWQLRDRRLAAEAPDGAPAVAPAGGLLPYRARGPENHYRPDDGALEQLVADWERCSLLIHQACEARGTRYYHFLQPNQYVPGSKPLSSEERRVAFSPAHPSRPAIEKGYELMRTAGRRLTARGVRFRDLSMVYAHSEETYYYDNCCHINRAGSEALAVPMARAILETAEPPLASTAAAPAGGP
ncbi:MAG TPA: hypothetical protein VFE78_02385 [Gemmataceae bacterium]|jgi:hypothetical protein|nr:hypothetical protein [Gemmataceae bacterium]